MKQFILISLMENSYVLGMGDASCTLQSQFLPSICWLPPLCVFSIAEYLLHVFSFFSCFPPPWESHFLPPLLLPPVLFRSLFSNGQTDWYVYRPDIKDFRFGCLASLYICYTVYYWWTKISRKTVIKSQTYLPKKQNASACVWTDHV